MVIHGKTPMRWCKTPYELNDNIIRIFITHRDEQGIGRVGFIDVQSTNPKKVINQSEKPVLNIGKGMFDESGVIACSVVEVDPNTIYMYHVGFELGKQIRYRLQQGLLSAMTEVNHLEGIRKLRYLKDQI